MEKNYLVVGCGQVGSRHLQGILKLEHSKNIYGIDPSASSIAVANERCLEINPDQPVTFSSELTTLKQKEFDLAIIATSSQHRLKILETLIYNTNVKRVILEKVLFPKLTEYQKALDILEKANVKAWVNCSKRYMPIYQRIKNETQPSTKISLHISGGGIGIACNAIHYIDLIHYFTKASLSRAFILNDASVFESKRKGYFEIEGTFIGEFEDGSHLVLTSKQSNDPWIMTITTSETQYILQEFQEFSIKRHIEATLWEKIQAIYGKQSSLTTDIVDNIMTTGDSRLVTLKESFIDNKVMLECFEGFFFKKGMDVRNGCPIT